MSGNDAPPPWLRVDGDDEADGNNDYAAGSSGVEGVPGWVAEAPVHPSVHSAPEQPQRPIRRGWAPVTQDEPIVDEPPQQEPAEPPPHWVVPQQHYAPPSSQQQPAPRPPEHGLPQRRDDNLAPPPGLDSLHLLNRARRPPRSGWRRAVHRASGGVVSPSDSKEQLELDRLIERVRQPIRGDFRLAVLSLKGGVGKTTTSIGLGSTFASLRGDRVIAVDANPDLGTLASRIPQQTNSNVRGLLNDPSVMRYSDVRAHTSQSLSRLEVLASERDPAVSEIFSEDDYRRTIGILQNHYNIIVTDCGTGLTHGAMRGVLELANAILLISSPAIDGAQSASATLDWLNSHGYHRLVSQAVVVISSAKPGAAAVDLGTMEQHFLSRARAVQTIPYDGHLAEGSHIDLELLHKNTRKAFVELAATVADSFPSNVGIPHGGAPRPWQG